MNFSVSQMAAIAATSAVSLVAPLPAAAQEAADTWTFSVMPYLWLPSVDGKLNFGPPHRGGSSANVSLSVDTSKLLDALDMAFMISGEARKGRWLMATDYIYIDLGNADSKVKSVDFNPGSGPVNISTTQLNAGTQISMKGSIWTLVGGYSVVPDKSASLDLIAGFRYLGLQAGTDWQLSAEVTGPLGTHTFPRTGSVDKSAYNTSAIVGAKGRVKLGESNWFVPYYVDVGGGDSVFTWQGSTGIGYDFRWGDVRLDYRYMYYDQGSDKLLQNVSLGGFGLSANFRF